MIAIGEDNTTLYLTRGDVTHEDYNRLAFYYPIYNFETQEEEEYEFQLDDKISLIIYEKKGYTKKELLKKDYTLRDLGYSIPSTKPEIVLTSEDTKVFELTNKPKTYWYDLVLNDTTTMLGYDFNGAKKMIVYPEYEESEEI